MNMLRWNDELERRPNGHEFLGAVLGSVASGLLGASASRSAADDQRRAAEAQLAEQRRQFDITSGQYDPWRQAGERGLAGYEQMLGGAGAAEGLIQSNLQDPFQFGAAEFEQYQDPGYQFRLSEGERALNRGAAGLGKRVSGERYAGLMDYGQQMGSQEFGAARSRALQDYTIRGGLEQEQYQRSLGAYNRQYADPMAGYAGLADMGLRAVGGLAGHRAGATAGAMNAIGAAGSAQAAGTLGAAGAWSSALGDIGQQLTGTGYGGGSGSSPLSSYAASPSQYDWSR